MTKHLIITSCLVSLMGCNTASLLPSVDTQIINGVVIDGTGAAKANLSVEISGKAITYVGPQRQVQAKSLIDASGLYVTPGLIDPHTHATWDLLDPRKADNVAYLHQGVATVFIGNDGGGHAVDATRRSLQEHRIGTNVGLWRGHGALRREVVGLAQRAPSVAEQARMEALLRRDMQAGALGLSSGLFYSPGSFATTDEVIGLAKVAAEYGGAYDTHIRDESDYNIGLIAAVSEALNIGRQANIAVHIAHLKALGPSVHGQSQQIIDTIKAAQADGLTVTADQYPWLASGTRLSNALIPSETKDGGVEAMRQRLRDREYVANMRSDGLANLRRRGGAEAILITGKSAYSGKTLAAAALEREMDALDLAIEIVLQGDPSIASFMMNPTDVSKLMQQPWVLTGSDGSNGHPRKYGTFPKKYQDYVVANPVLSVEQFVHRSTGLTAEAFGLCRRGKLRPGYFADVAIWHPEDYESRADYQNPTQLAAGVMHLLVNGTHVIQAGVITGARPGEVLNRLDCDANSEDLGG